MSELVETPLRSEITETASGYAEPVSGIAETASEAAKPAPWDAPTTPRSPRWVDQLTNAAPLSARQAFWMSFVALFLIAGVWAIANPLMASVDEPAHTIMAAATVLQAPNIATEYEVTGLGPYATTGVGIVEIPSLFRQMQDFPYCFARIPTQPASCQPSLWGDLTEITPVSTSAIDYNPLYYFVVGLPALFPSGGYFTIYLMRLVNAAFGAVVIAMAVRTVAELTRRRWLGVAIIIALTPTAINLLGSINPQSIEVAGTILLWVTLLALFTEPRPDLLWRRVIRVIVGALLISNARGLGPMFTFMIVVLVIALIPWSRVRYAFTDTRTWWAVAGGVFVTALGTFWIFFAGSLPQGTGSGIGWGEALRVTFDSIGWFLYMQIGVFGWLDVAPPQWFYLLGGALIAVLLVLAFAAGRRRERLVLGLVAAIMIFMPMAIESYQARIIGYFWQGRYIFPISLGLILLAGWVLDRYAAGVPTWLQNNAVVVLASSFAFLNVVGFIWNLQRYVNGIQGSWLRLGPESWSPPINPFLVTLLYIIAWGLFTTAVIRATADQTEDLVERPEEPELRPYFAPLELAPVQPTPAEPSPVWETG
ncbi:MAG: DUF2142 domain-containing protein [Promicromonosporaceae bacterium]|nr:DUF2142 domain-containing protein [Promicromonosporaceae bacterium]